MHSKNSIKRWCVGLRHCTELLPQSVTIQMHGACKLAGSCKERSGPELAIPHYRSPFHILCKEGDFLSFPLPFFSFSTSPLPKAGLRFGENYAHCLIPDMDRSGQRVWRQIISCAAKHSWPQWKTQHIKTHFRQGCHCMNKCFKPWMINTILHLTGYGRGKKNHMLWAAMTALACRMP